MLSAGTIERQLAALAFRQGSPAREPDLKSTRSSLTVAIARQAGTPGTSVARELGAALGWPVYDHELLQRVAQDTGLQTQVLEQLDERRQSWLMEAVEAFRLEASVSEGSYVHHLVRAILALGARGSCIIVGRGAAHLLAPRLTLRVRLVAPEADRIAVAASRLGMAEDKAATWVERTERERRAFVRDHFANDPQEPANYDIVLNTAVLSVADCAALIRQALDAKAQHLVTDCGEAPINK